MLAREKNGINWRTWKHVIFIFPLCRASRAAHIHKNCLNHYAKSDLKLFFHDNSTTGELEFMFIEFALFFDVVCIINITKSSLFLSQPSSYKVNIVQKFWQIYIFRYFLINIFSESTTSVPCFEDFGAFLRTVDAATTDGPEVICRKKQSQNNHHAFNYPLRPLSRFFQSLIDL